MIDFGFLLLGVICAGIGGDLFVRGLVGIARWARVSAGIIGATFAAFATSSPELSVSVTSALSGTPQIALGDALGSNVANVGLILGLALLVAPLHSAREATKRDFPVALAVPILLGILAQDGLLSFLDGIVLLTMFVVWTSVIVVEAKRQRDAAGAVLGEARHGRAAVESLIGLVFLVASGKFIVNGAKGIATSYGVDPFVIGSTLVAIGTSTPEIATVVISRLKGHDEVGLGTILGSNIFNGLFIVGVAAVINPIPVTWREVTVGLVFGLLTTLIVYPFGGNLIERRRGVALVSLYAVYLAVLVQPCRMR
jgi:cation:H+ antiporter